MFKFTALETCHVTRCHGNGGKCGTENAINQKRYIVFKVDDTPNGRSPRKD